MWRLALFAILFLAAVAIIGINGMESSANHEPLRRFENAGHYYLERPYGSSVDKPFIHDPDCPCTLNP